VPRGAKGTGSNQDSRAGINLDKGGGMCGGEGQGQEQARVAPGQVSNLKKKFDGVGDPGRRKGGGRKEGSREGKGTSRITRSPQPVQTNRPVVF